MWITMCGMRSLFLIPLLCLAALPAWSRVIAVPRNEPTLATAMVNASRGDTIRVSSGVYQETVMLRSGVWMQSIAGPGRTTIRGASGRPVVHVPIGGRNTGLEGFTLEGGSVGVKLNGSSLEVQECYVKLPMETAFECGSRGELYLRSCGVERCATGIQVDAGGRLSVLNCQVTRNKTGIVVNTDHGRIFRSRIAGNEVGLQIGPRGVPNVGGTKKFGNDFLDNQVAVWSLADTLLTLPFNAWGVMACDSIQARIRGQINFLPAVSLDRSEILESCN